VKAIEDSKQEWADAHELKKAREDPPLKVVEKEGKKTVVKSEEDEVLQISSKKKQKKLKKREKMEEKPEESNSNKRVRFDLTQNKITEFFKHGKVAQRVLYSSK